MTVKEYNAVRHAAYVAAIESEDVRKAFTINNIVWIFEVVEGDKHKIFALSAKTQMNKVLLLNEGFSQNASVHQRMILDRATKCATFCGL